MEVGQKHRVNYGHDKNANLNLNLCVWETDQERESSLRSLGFSAVQDFDRNNALRTRARLT